MKTITKTMIKKISLIAFLCIFVSCSFIFFSLLYSSAYVAENEEDEIEEVNIEDSIEFAFSSEPHDTINFNIFEDIARAQDLLENENCGFQVVKSKVVVQGKKAKKAKKASKAKTGKKASKSKTIVKNELGEFNILLAVEHVKDREIKVVRVHPRFGAKSNGFVVEPGRSNGVNTKFTITNPEHHIVLALKRPVRHGTTFKEVVYTPYSEGLDIPEVRKAGLDYLKNILDTAKSDLFAKRVRPLSGDKFIDDDVSLTLAIIEHIDPVKFGSDKYTTEKLINETLVIMGTNKQNAYRYSTSKAGARGLFQFIPDTYKRIEQLYPHAGLKKDFIQGMDDHENAAKASFLLFDADMRSLNNGKKEKLMNNPQALGRFLASAYNCGAGRTRNAMYRYGDNWHSGVPAETQTYLKKYDAVWEWLQRHQLAMQ
jgi:hypothetical protein